MKPLGHPELHFWLTRSVARRSQVSLSEAMARNLLTSDDYAQLVTPCRTCPHTEICETWLAQPCTRDETAPPGCVNAGTFATLAEHIGAPLHRTRGRTREF